MLAAIDHLRGGGASEDDRIEFKRDWPEPGKARQLAAAANRNHGNPLIYVIGVDDQTGQILPAPSLTDVASWWAGIEARFDQVAPELLRDLTVFAGSGAAVTALLFATDRAPYVIKAEGGSPEREVPIRDGTRTRSAHRHELLRMLVPAIATPPAVLLGAEVSGQWFAAIEGEGGRGLRPESTYLYGRATIFFEHSGAGSVLLPLHEMSGELICEELRIPLRPRPHPPQNMQASATVFGVDVRRDGVVVSGPGRLDLPLAIEALPGDHRTQLEAIDRWELSVILGVTGAVGQVRIQAPLKREAQATGRRASEFVEPLPRWKYG